MVQRRGLDRDADFARLGGGGVRHVSYLDTVGGIPAGTREDAGAHALRPYGRNAGVTICSVPTVGIGTGVPEPTGWMYTL